jgi:hypothetical protein
MPAATMAVSAMTGRSRLADNGISYQLEEGDIKSINQVPMKKLEYLSKSLFP